MRRGILAWRPRLSISCAVQQQSGVASAVRYIELGMLWRVTFRRGRSEEARGDNAKPACCLRPAERRRWRACLFLSLRALPACAAVCLLSAYLPRLLQTCWRGRRQAAWRKGAAPRAISRIWAYLLSISGLPAYVAHSVLSWPAATPLCAARLLFCYLIARHLRRATSADTETYCRYCRWAPHVHASYGVVAHGWQQALRGRRAGRRKRGRRGAELCRVGAWRLVGVDGWWRSTAVRRAAIRPWHRRIWASVLLSGRGVAYPSSSARTPWFVRREGGGAGWRRNGAPR